MLLDDNIIQNALKEARERISEPENWTQGHAAENPFCVVVNPQDSSAVKFCAVGSISASLGSGHLGDLAVAHLRASMGSGSVAEYNDSHTHEEVLALFDKAIATLDHSS